MHLVARSPRQRGAKGRGAMARSGDLGAGEGWDHKNFKAGTQGDKGLVLVAGGQG